MNIDDIAALLEGRPELQAFMLEVIDCTPEELQALTALLRNVDGIKNLKECIQILVILMECRPETIEKGVQCLDLLRNKDMAELIGLLPQIKDEKRIKALVCWAEQYKG